MNIIKGRTPLVGLAAIGVLSLSLADRTVAQGATTQSTPIADQVTGCANLAPPIFFGDREILEGSNMTIIRTPGGVSATATLPTPVPGSYCYPPGKSPGFPEIYTLWFIYFNNPDGCRDGPGLCGAQDVLSLFGGDCQAAQAGAVHIGGHAVGGPRLNLAGHAEVGADPMLGCAPLGDTETTEVHVAIAPHGGLATANMPSELKTPTPGGPGYWFATVFEPEE